MEDAGRRKKDPSCDWLLWVVLGVGVRRRMEEVMEMTLVEEEEEGKEKGMEASKSLLVP